MSSRVKFLVGLLTFSIVMRLLPYFLTKYDIKIDGWVIFYPWNFMPLTATCLFAGAYFTDRRVSIGLPLLAVLFSDVAIWIVTGKFEWAFPSDRWSAYLCYPLIIMMGTGLNREDWPIRAGDALFRGMAAEALFFLVTNFAYFLVQKDVPHTFSGLGVCYIMAVPFAAKAFASSAFYAVLMFSPLAVHLANGIGLTSTLPAQEPIAVGK